MASNEITGEESVIIRQIISTIRVSDRSVGNYLMAVNIEAGYTVDLTNNASVFISYECLRNFRSMRYLSEYETNRIIESIHSYREPRKDIDPTQMNRPDLRPDEGSPNANYSHTGDIRSIEMIAPLGEVGVEDGGAICLECGAVITVSKANYCPKCGAHLNFTLNAIEPETNKSIESNSDGKAEGSTARVLFASFMGIILLLCIVDLFNGAEVLTSIMTKVKKQSQTNNVDNTTVETKRSYSTSDIEDIYVGQYVGKSKAGSDVSLSIYPDHRWISRDEYLDYHESGIWAIEGINIVIICADWPQGTKLNGHYKTDLAGHPNLDCLWLPSSMVRNAEYVRVSQSKM